MSYQMLIFFKQKCISVNSATWRLSYWQTILQSIENNSRPQPRWCKYKI